MATELETRHAFERAHTLICRMFEPAKNNASKSNAEKEFDKSTRELTEILLFVAEGFCMDVKRIATALEQIELNTRPRQQ